MAVRVQAALFDCGAEIDQLRCARSDTGALVAFVGQMREMNADVQVAAMTLEHYPGMTEKSLAAIEQKARQRWGLHEVLVVHRVGSFLPQDPIVLVIVTAAHRHSAFEACSFIMDYLKTEAPFWKKEKTAAGEHWVEARVSDMAAMQRWEAASR